MVPTQVQQRIGLTTARVVFKHKAAQIDAFAKVLDPGPLAQLDSDLRSAQAAATASQSEAQREKALNQAGGSVAAKDAEATVAQAQSDAAKVSILKDRLGLEWGPGIARMNDAQRQRLIHALASGSVALVHVDTPNNVGQAGARLVSIDVGDGSAKGVVIGAARAAEPRLQSSGLIAEVSGPLAILLSVGLTQSAHIESTDKQTGAVIPRSAVVRYLGLDWAYVRTAPTRFERRLIQDPVVEEDGLFAAHGFAAGDEVVDRGAMALFADEQASR